MNVKSQMRSAARWLAAGVGLAAGAYATYVGVAWYRYGHVPNPASAEERDELLDRFMPKYEVVERRQIQIAAPADITFAAACDVDLMQSPIIRAIFRTRELASRLDQRSAGQPLSSAFFMSAVICRSAQW